MNAKQLRFAKTLLLTLLVLGASYLIRIQTASAHSAAWTVAGYALSAWMVVRIALRLRRGHAAFKRHTRDGIRLASVDQAVQAGMPDWARGYYALEKRMYAAVWRALSRQPLRMAGEFSVAHGPRVAWLSAWSKPMVLGLPVAVYAGCADLGVAPGFTWVATAAVATLALYLLAWIIGARRVLAESGHAVSLDQLELNLGLYACATVPMAAVVRCLDASVVGELPAADVWTLAPSELPNVVIELDGPTILHGQRLGTPITVRKYFIALYVDEPARFMAAVEHALPTPMRAYG
jgi:hypothetical protein